MKKLYSLLTLIVCLLCSVTGAKADTDAPLLSTSSTQYLYKIRLSAGSNLYVSKPTSSTLESAVDLKYANSGSYTALTFVFRASSSQPGCFNIYAVIDNVEYPVTITSATAGANVQLSPTSSTPANFYIEKSTQKNCDYYIKEKTTGYVLKNSDSSSSSPFPLQLNSNGASGNWFQWVFVYAGSTTLTSDEVALGNTQYTNMTAVRSNSTAYTGVQSYVTALEAAQTAGNISESGSKLGYPTSEATTTFLTTADKLLNYNYSDLSSEFSKATSTLLSTITMPEAGKVYQIKAVFPGDATSVLFWNGSAINGYETSSTETSSYWFCGESGSKYFFVNKDGKYLNWFDSDDTSASKGANATGATDEYDATYNLWTLEAADLTTASDGSIDSDLTLATLLGRFQLKGTGNSSIEYYLNPQKATSTTDGINLTKFVSSVTGTKFYGSSTGNTYTFTLEEVTNYTPMSFASAGKGYATYSTPFPVEIPENVKAYTATSVSNGTVSLKALTGSYIPEDTGVLVKYTSDLPKTFIPVPAAVTNTEAGSVTDNQFVATGGDGTKVNDNTTAYILGVSNSELGFYKLSSSDRNIAAFRAYLTLPASATTEGAVKMVFEDETTGIHAAEINDSESQAPIYDLTGHRVKTTTAGSLYIKGGKKFIAK